MPLNQRLLVVLVLLLVNIVVAAFATGEGAGLVCVPCIERPNYTIKAIVHGTTDDRFWKRVKLASEQAAKDMRVELDFELYDPDVFDFERMAKDIEATATGESPPDALIVTIPSPEVQAAVKEATKYVPIFGMNSGYDVAADAGVLDFIAMDEQKGGELAAEEFQKESSNITKALFINHAKGNNAVENRLLGFTEGFGSLDTLVDELVVDVNLPDEAADLIASAMEGCEYDAVLLAGSQATLEMTLEGIEECLDSGTLLGSFDVGERAYSEIAVSRLSFTIAQQEHLQGTLSVVAAATYATTEKKLSSSDAAFGTYLSGPKIINFANLPSDSLQACEEDAFPVCPRTTALDDNTNSTCPCLERSNIRIAGVLHGIKTDGFWDIVFAQAQQAANDLGVELILDRLEQQEDYDTLIRKMASQISSRCKDGVDGIFISFPSEFLFEAVKECQELNVPVISVNAGAAFAEELGLTHHIAQLEYDAGFKAGKRMAQEGATTGICLVYEDGNEALVQRCSGFENGFKEESIDATYLGSPIVPFDLDERYKLQVSEFIDSRIETPGDWDGIAALSIGPATVPALMELKRDHPGLLVGTFDTNQVVFDELDSGNLLFGIDQNPFMQGYMPVWLLTVIAHTKQNLQNPYIKTGPRFVEEAPSNALKSCTANDFQVCAPPVETDMNQLEKLRPVGLVFAGISMILSVILMGWVFFYRETSVVRKSQPLFLAMICVGTFFMAATIIPMSIDDSIASEQACTIACMAVPWFFWIGFIFAFSALSSKIERIRKLIDSARSFRRVKVTAWDVMGPFLGLLALTLVFLLVWTIVDPMFWVRTNVSGSVDGRSTFGYCAIGQTAVSKAMVSCLTILAFACVVRACVSAWYARRVSVEYAESKYISVIIIGMLQTFPIGIPLIILSFQNPPAKYFLQAAIIFALTLSIQLLIFLPKINFLRRDLAKAKSDASRRSVSSSISMPRSSAFGNSLRVIGMNYTTVESTYQLSAPVAANKPAQAVSEITNKNVEDLRDLLKETGQVVDDTTDLRSLMEKVGIVVSDGKQDEKPSDGDDSSTSGAIAAPNDEA